MVCQRFNEKALYMLELLNAENAMCPTIPLLSTATSERVSAPRFLRLMMCASVPLLNGSEAKAAVVSA